MLLILLKIYSIKKRIQLVIIVEKIIRKIKIEYNAKDFEFISYAEKNEFICKTIHIIIFKRISIPILRKSERTHNHTFLVTIKFLLKFNTYHFFFFYNFKDLDYKVFGTRDSKTVFLYSTTAVFAINGIKRKGSFR